MKKVLYMHTGSGNHGCEAIVRTTAKLLGGPKDVVLWSNTKQEDVMYGSAGEFEDVVVSEQIRRYSPGYFEALIRRKLLRNSKANLQIFLREQFRGNAAISVGGDNYCYPWSARQAVELDREIRKHCACNVLWGCSVNPEAIAPEVREDLAGFDLITAREPITYDLLKKINPRTVKTADPAFLLERVDLPLPDGFAEGNTVGINMSPLILQYGSTGELILENYRCLMEFILEQTELNLCLIPHVVWPYNDDREPMELLYSQYSSTGRVSRIQDGNCMELKGYIARCRMFVGARTHATIAAYSSCVPTLVAGYSVKSRGIAQDLFGTDSNYVLPVQSLTSREDLTKQFVWLMEHQQEQRTLLEQRIPEYQQQARAAASFLAQLQK